MAGYGEYSFTNGNEMAPLHPALSISQTIHAPLSMKGFVPILVHLFKDFYALSRQAIMELKRIICAATT
jgi:hypothetical protein